MEKNKQTIFIAVIALLIVALAILGFFTYQLSGERTDALVNLEQKQDELQSTYLQMDSLSIRLQEVLAEKERLGEQDDSLRQVIAQLEKEKRQVRSGVDLTNRRYQEIKNKLADYENLIAAKDREIAQLRQENTALRSQKDSLSATTENLSGRVDELAQTTEKLSSKLNQASALKAYGLQVIAINKKGKERDEGEYKARQIDQIKIIFQIGENKAADPGNRKILIRLIEPNGKVVSDLTAGSGSFTYNGEERLFTTAKEILYDNTAQRVTVLYNRGGAEYASGKHTVELYAEGNLIGQTSFLVK